MEDILREFAMCGTRGHILRHRWLCSDL